MPAEARHPHCAVAEPKRRAPVSLNASRKSASGRRLLVAKQVTSRCASTAVSSFVAARQDQVIATWNGMRDVNKVSRMIQRGVGMRLQQGEHLRLRR